MMDLRRVWAVLLREFTDLRHNPRLLFSIYLLPLLFGGLAIPGLVRGMDAIARSTASHHPAIHARAHRPAHLQAKEAKPPTFDGPAGMEPVFERLRREPGQVGAFFIVAEFMGFVFMFAMLQPISLGAQAIVGEKQEGTLEPLLATPLETGELLLAKALFAVVPGVAVSWAMYGLELWSASAILKGDLVRDYFASPTWLLAIFALVPLLSLFTTLGLLAVSSWVTDPRTAQQLGALLVFPLIGAGMALLFGAVTFRALVVGAIVVLALACFALLQIAVRVFRREAILTRWR